MRYLAVTTARSAASPCRAARMQCWRRGDQGVAVRAQASQAQSTAPKSDLLEERSVVDAATVSQDAAVADAILLQNRKKQKQDINDESGSQKQEAQLVAVNDKKDDGAQPPAADVIACAHCNREISKNDNFCMHCGASVAAEKRAAKTRLCSSCRQEIGTSDKFCRHCGTSSLAVSAPSMNGNRASPDRAHSVDHHDRVRSSLRQELRSRGSDLRGDDRVKWFRGKG